MAEYAVLAGLLWRAVRRRGGVTDRQPWDRREALAAVVLAALFAATDEWHQSTVPSRQGQLSDVLIDTAGAIGGLVAIWVVGRKRKCW